MGPFWVGQLLVCKAVEVIAGVIAPGGRATVVALDDDGTPIVQTDSGGMLRLTEELWPYFTEAA
jgi:hypothetical protein